jgi:hypothetical protein
MQSPPGGEPRLSAQEQFEQNMDRFITRTRPAFQRNADVLIVTAFAIQYVGYPESAQVLRNQLQGDVAYDTYFPSLSEEKKETFKRIARDLQRLNVNQANNILYFCFRFFQRYLPQELNIIRAILQRVHQSIEEEDRD